MKKILLILMLAMGGCTPILTTIMGLKRPQVQTPADIQQWAAKSSVGIKGDIYELDTSYCSWIRAISSDSAASRKILTQPLLVLYFKGNKLVSVNNNCAFPGAPDIQWNVSGNFNSFPPVTSYPDSLFTNVSLPQFVALLKPVSVAKQQQWDAGEQLFVVYSKAFNRQSKNLIHLIQKQYAAKQAHIHFVNNDDVVYNLIGNAFE